VQSNSSQFDFRAWLSPPEGWANYSRVAPSGQHLQTKCATRRATCFDQKLLSARLKKSKKYPLLTTPTYCCCGTFLAAAMSAGDDDPGIAAAGC